MIQRATLNSKHFYIHNIHYNITLFKEDFDPNNGTSTDYVELAIHKIYLQSGNCMTNQFNPMLFMFCYIVSTRTKHFVSCFFIVL